MDGTDGEARIEESAGVGQGMLAQAAATDLVRPQGGAYNAFLDPCRVPTPGRLVTVTLSRRLFIPTSRSLPTASVLLFLIKAAWIGSNPVSIAGELTCCGCAELRVVVGMVVQPRHRHQDPPPPATCSDSAPRGSAGLHPAVNSFWSLHVFQRPKNHSGGQPEGGGRQRPAGPIPRSLMLCILRSVRSAIRTANCLFSPSFGQPRFVSAHGAPRQPSCHCRAGGPSNARATALDGM